MVPTDLQQLEERISQMMAEQDQKFQTMMNQVMQHMVNMQSAPACESMLTPEMFSLNSDQPYEAMGRP